MEETLTAQADKKRPYKLYAAMVSAFITSILAAGLDVPAYVSALLTALVASIAVYLIPNPIVLNTEDQADDPQHIEDAEGRLF